MSDDGRAQLSLPRYVVRHVLRSVFIWLGAMLLLYHLLNLGGLGYLPGENGPDTSTAHAVRWFIGVLY